VERAVRTNELEFQKGIAARILRGEGEMEFSGDGMRPVKPWEDVAGPVPNYKSFIYFLLAMASNQTLPV
jgi:hypothetical protein